MANAAEPGLMSSAAAARLRGMATADLLRWLLVLLSALLVVGTATELAMLRHWKSPIQTVPWVALAVVAAAAVLLVVQPTRPAVWIVRAMAVAVAVSAAVGLYVHARENYDSGPLDYRYTATWATMPETERWWAAITKTVGPAPPIAPAALGQAALILLFATIRHPALAREPRAFRQVAAAEQNPEPAGAD